MTNERLETLMEQAVATVQRMDPAEYQAKVGSRWGHNWVLCSAGL